MSSEQSLECEQLEVLEHQVAADEASLAQCMEKANASLSSKEATIQAAAKEKITKPVRRPSMNIAKS